MGHDANSPLSIAIVEDQTIVRELLAQFLATVDSYRVDIKVDKGGDFLKALDSTPVDLVLLDVGLPDMHGVDVLAKLKQRKRPPKVLAVTAVNDASTLRQLLEAGVNGIVTKGAPLEQLKSAITTTISGGVFLDGAAASLVNTAPRAESALTARERQIAVMVARGLTSKEIGSELDITEKTVTNHRTSLMKKIGVSNSAGIARFVAQQGWV